ncbi:MAG: LacI family transcriptional regulator [Oscillospiraceae bacterium]|nr:LacI family transcriptional regulator [Oscillospiraceae bacterium]
MNRASIKDVAKAAGVSTTTVSYVLNMRSGESFSPETVSRVMKAARTLNYVPNQSARSLINRQSRLIGVVIPQTEPGKEFMFNNPFYGEFLSAVEYTARENQYHLLISGTDRDQSYVNIARNRDVDGIIVVGTYPDDQLEALKGVGAPVVLVDSYVEDAAFCTIGNDDRAGGRMATEYFLRQGHRRIAFVSGSIREYGVNERRYRGYLDALSAAGIPFAPEFIYEGNVDVTYGIEAALQRQARGGGETAALVSADILAMGYVKGLRQCGLSVPGDVSVMGFDDVYLAELCDPSLTTVRQDIREKGRLAAQAIIDAARGAAQPQRRVILPLEIIERQSVRTLFEEAQP